MHHRRLTSDELRELETEFIRFLSSQGIDGPTWQSLKTNNPDRAEEILDEFSRFIYESTIDQLEYLEFKTPNDIKCFHCGPDGMTLLGLFIEGNSDVDFTQEFHLESARESVHRAGARLKMYRSRKAYVPDRRSEIFKMMEYGCRISRDGMLYQTLNAVAQQQNG